MVTKNEIHDAAITLPESERVGLIIDLLDSVGVEHHEVSDEEVLRRKEAWDRGEVSGVSWEEVKKACGRD